MKRTLSVLLSLAVVLVTLATAVGNASAASLPGDPLYTVKRAQENAMMSLASGGTWQQLDQRFLQERHDEVQALIGLKRSVIFEYVGTVEYIGAKIWRVGGFYLFINHETHLDETLTVGQKATVRAKLLFGGRLLALSINALQPDDPATATPTPTPSPTPYIEESATPIPTSTPIPGGD